MIIVTWTSEVTGYTGVEACEYRISRWPEGQPLDDPFVRFETTEYEGASYEHVSIETRSADRVVLSVLRTIHSHTEWEHHAVGDYQINGARGVGPTDLMPEFDPYQYYSG